MPLVNVTLAEGVFTEKQKHDMAARLTDVMVALPGIGGLPGQSEADALMLPSVHAVYVRAKPAQSTCDRERPN